MTLTLKTNMLAFSRSLELSDGLMLAGTWECAQDALVPVEVRRIGVRGQTSNASSKTDKENWGASNPQRVEVATMPPEKDTLFISFTLRVLANSRKPFATDSFEVANSYRQLAETFNATGGYAELARRYLTNIANGRFAWRKCLTCSRVRRIRFMERRCHPVRSIPTFPDPHLEVFRSGRCCRRGRRASGWPHRSLFQGPIRSGRPDEPESHLAGSCQ